jgi:multidrug efflux pump subunit AcrA (membrane-fusion protein)
MRQIHCKELKVSRPPLVTKFVTRYARVSLLPLIAAGVGLGLGLGLAGCKPKTSAAGAGFTMPPGGMPVQTQTADETAVPMTDTYVATIKSRRSATINPQVTGNLISIAVHSGEHVNKGQVLMEIDPFKQRAMVDSTAATEQQKLAVYQYNQSEVERQRKLFEGGITSRDAYDQALQSFRNAKADYESSVASTGTQKQELAYYRIVAPFAGMVGDVPVHIGDYVAASTLLHCGPGRQGARDEPGRLSVAAGGQRAAGHPGEGPGTLLDGRQAEEPAAGEGAGDVVGQADGDDSSAGGNAAGRAEFCVHCPACGAGQICRPPSTGGAG